MKLIDRSWIFEELHQYGYRYKDIGDYLGYSETTVIFFIKGKRVMPFDVLMQLLTLITLERRH